MPLEDDRREEERQAKGKEFMKKTLSNIVLVITVCIYIVGGAALFKEIEEQGVLDSIEAAKRRAVEIEKERDLLSETLWMHRQEKTYSEVVDDLIEGYHKNVTEAIENNSYKGRPFENGDLSNGWSFASALLFTITVVTTIGYGHVSPTTSLGQLVLIVYALVGIPLMLVMLAMIGDAMAKFFRTAYGRGCCRCCNSRRDKEYLEATRMQELADVRSQSKKGKLGDANSGRPKSAWSVDMKDEADMGAETVTTVVEESGGDQEDVSGINVPITLVLCVIFAYVIVGAILFSAWNEWTMITGAYFSFVTLSTIGFGDLVPGWSELGTTSGTIKLIISNVYIVVGLAVLSMSFNLMMEEMLEKIKWLGKKIGIIDDETQSDAVVPVDTDRNASISADTADLVDNAV